MKYFYFLFLLSIIAIAGNSAQAQQIVLSANGQSEYVISTPEDAAPAETNAAVQFQKYFQQITGAQLTIKTETETGPTQKQILIGAGHRVKTLLPNQNWNELGHDGILIKTVGHQLILAGGRPRGTLYAVYQFLEDVAGCRWWTPTVNFIPSKKSFAISPQDITYIPPFSYRQHSSNASYGEMVAVDKLERNAANEEFTTILRLNGNRPDQSASWGGNYTVLGWVHTFSKLLPPQKYFKDHPEWYSDPDNGFKPATASSKMPPPQKTDLCLGNPEVVDAMATQALELIKTNPEAGYISISQNDHNGHYCRDEPTVKLIEEEGSAAAPLLKFVNAVAQKIHAVYPDFIVETLAYHHTDKPPKTIRPAKNVMIRLVPTDRDFAQPLANEANRKNRDLLLGWQEISPQIFTWNYITNFNHTMMPYPNRGIIKKDLEFYRNNHVKSVLFEGNITTNGNADFSPLRNWLIGKLLWNPDLDQEALTKEFLQGYYGAAAPYIEQYLELIEKAVRNNQQRLSAFEQDFSFLTLDVMNEATHLFNMAQAAVKSDAVLTQRVGQERLSIDLAWLWQYNAYRQIAQKTGKAFAGPANPQAAITDFYAKAQSYNVKLYRNKVPLQRLISQLRNFTTPSDSHPLPAELKHLNAEHIIDVQQNFFLDSSLYTYPATPDTLASDGYATRLDHSKRGERPLRFYPWPHAVLYQDHNWKAYAVVRAEVNENKPFTGKAFDAGILNLATMTYPSRKTLDLSLFADGQYHVIELGNFRKQDMYHLQNYLFLELHDNENLKDISIDRIILAR